VELDSKKWPAVLSGPKGIYLVYLIGNTAVTALHSTIYQHHSVLIHYSWPLSSDKHHTCITAGLKH